MISIQYAVFLLEIVQLYISYALLFMSCYYIVATINIFLVAIPFFQAFPEKNL